MDGSGARWALHLLLRRVTHFATSGDQNGVLDALGYEFAMALRQLHNKGRLYENEAAVPGVDPIKLHRSTRAKSGYVGIYSNGKGFRAEGKDPKNTHNLITLGTFPTAEGAAWARYRHYKQYGIMYGQLEEAVDERRKEEMYRAMPDDVVKHHVIWDAANLIKTPIEDLTPEERALERVDPFSGKRS